MSPEYVGIESAEEMTQDIFLIGLDLHSPGFPTLPRFLLPDNYTLFDARVIVADHLSATRAALRGNPDRPSVGIPSETGTDREAKYKDGDIYLWIRAEESAILSQLVIHQHDDQKNSLSNAFFKNR